MCMQRDGNKQNLWHVLYCMYVKYNTILCLPTSGMDIQYQTPKTLRPHQNATQRINPKQRNTKTLSDREPTASEIPTYLDT